MSSRVLVRFENSEAAQAAMNRRAGAVLRALQQGIGDAVALVYGSVLRKLTGPVLKVQTGRLRRSIQAFVDIAAKPRGIVGTNVEYAKIHEFGGHTAAHLILPRTKKALRFTIGGRTVFASQVHHPGSVIPARPFMSPSLQENRERIIDLLSRRLSAALKGAT